jgi:hypothetical protein
MTTPTPEPTTAQVLDAVRITQAFYARDTTPGLPYSTLADDLAREVGRLEQDVEREKAQQVIDDKFARALHDIDEDSKTFADMGRQVREYLRSDGWMHRDDFKIGVEQATS